MAEENEPKEDVESLKKTIDILNKTIDNLNRTIENNNEIIDGLQNQIKNLNKMFFGSKSEKTKKIIINENSDQTTIFDYLDYKLPASSEIENNDETLSKEKIEITYTRAKQRKRNDYFGDNIEVEEVHINDAPLFCSCGHEMVEIGSGQVEREEVIIIPKQVIKRQYINHTFECLECKKDSNKNNKIVKGTLPINLIAHSVISPSFAADMIYQKFCLYLPFYRQQKDLERYGFNINDNIMSSWAIMLSELYLKPIYERLIDIILAKEILLIDETPYKILRRSDGKAPTSKSYNWVMRSLPIHGPIITIFQSELSRSKNTFKNVIKDFEGVVQSDGYAVYKNVEGIAFSSCFSHVRRKFIECNSELGNIGVNYCNKLFSLERKYKGYKAAKRRKARQKESKKVVDEFIEWMKITNVNKKSALGRAIQYTLGLKEKLTYFLKDGRVEISTNAVENAIRPSTLLKKNCLFSTSEAGAQANAIYLSMVETAKSAKINVFKYLNKLFEELPSLDLSNENILDSYMPWSRKIQESCK